MTRLIYIHGFPRSGTTLLGDCLATSPGLGHFGEMSNVWMPERFEGSRRRCGCGPVLLECGVWGSVAPHVTALRPGTRRLLQVRSRDDGLRLAMHLLRGTPAGIEAAQAYRDLVERLAALSDVDVAVDSSKTSVHLLLALRSGLLTGVALARRSRRETIASRWRHRRQARTPRRSLGPVRTGLSRGLDSARWMATTALGAVLAAGGAGLVDVDSATVRLEDLRTSLWPTLDEATSRLDLGTIPDRRRLGSDRIRLDATHTVWGSRSRFDNVGDVRVA